jgi:hypothetical protein
LYFPISAYSVSPRVGVPGGSQADSLVSGVIDAVETFQEGISINEIEALATRCTNLFDSCQWWTRTDKKIQKKADVGDNEIDAVGSTTNKRVECSGPDLRIGSQREGAWADFEMEVSEGRVLC